MELTINKYNFGDKPEVTRPTNEFLVALGEEGIRKMVSKHYDLMRISPIKDMFPKDDAEFEIAKRNSADFMIQICGGPDYFNQNRGKPMMSNRHSKFTITPEGRIIWLNCYKEALLELEIKEELVLSFWNYINVFSSWIVNSPSQVYKVGDLK